MNIFDVVIEIPFGSNMKYEYDKVLQRMRLDRVLSCAMTYPGNYGFIPKTLAPDGDELDILICSNYAIDTGSVVECKVIGVLIMEDEKGMDEKIIAVPSDNIDCSFKKILELEDLNKYILKNIEHFFAHYKKNEKKKWSKVHQFEPKEKALKLIKQYQDKYKQPNIEETINIVENNVSNNVSNKSDKKISYKSDKLEECIDPERDDHWKGMKR